MKQFSRLSKGGKNGISRDFVAVKLYNTKEITQLQIPKRPIFLLIMVIWVAEFSRENQASQKLQLSKIINSKLCSPDPPDPIFREERMFRNIKTIFNVVNDLRYLYLVIFVTFFHFKQFEKSFKNLLQLFKFDFEKIKQNYPRN